MKNFTIVPALFCDYDQKSTDDTVFLGRGRGWGGKGRLLSSRLLVQLVLAARLDGRLALQLLQRAVWPVALQKLQLFFVYRPTTMPIFVRICVKLKLFFKLCSNGYL